MKVTGSTIQQLEKDKPRSRCRKWRIWATTEEGRRSVRFTGTYTQAQERQKEFVSEIEAEVRASETFGEYAESWRRWREKSGDYSPNTLAGDSTAVNSLRRTCLDGMKVSEIGPADCRDALLWLKENPVKTGELKPSTVAKLHQVLGAIMQQAEDDGKTAANPMRKVKAPKAKLKEREAMSPLELSLFLDRLDELPLDGRAMAVYLMACLGLRCGEACALKDSEIDSRYACVTSTVRAADRSVGPTKSNAGTRTIPVPRRLAEKVAQWRAVRAHGVTLCCGSDGGRLSPSSVSGWWRGGNGCVGARDKLGCPGFTLHQLRHSNLSMMARHMSPFDLQRYAGWSSIAPAKIYVHDDLDVVSRAVELAWNVG
jgi:integrase